MRRGNPEMKVVNADDDWSNRKRWRAVPLISGGIADEIGVTENPRASRCYDRARIETNIIPTKSTHYVAFIVDISDPMAPLTVKPATAGIEIRHQDSARTETRAKLRFRNESYDIELGIRRLLPQERTDRII